MNRNNPENIAFFTTSNPGFFCDTSDCNEEFIQSFDGKKRFINFLDGEIPIRSIYIDGTLEENLRFDIPIWIEGEISRRSYQACRVFNVAGTKSYEAVLHLFQEDQEYYSHKDAVWQLRGFITLPDETNNIANWKHPNRYRELPEEEL